MARANELTTMSLPIHQRMLRHCADYRLADERHDRRANPRYPGHKNVTPTVPYTELSPERFKAFGTRLAASKSAVAGEPQSGTAESSVSGIL